MNHPHRHSARRSLAVGVLLPLVLGACSGPGGGPTAADAPRTPPESPSVTGSRSAPELWPGPVRPGSGQRTLSKAQAKRWADPSDVDVPGIDIRAVEDARVSSRPRHPSAFRQAGAWLLETTEPPPRWDDLYVTNQRFLYGVVVDADGDGDADCEIGIGNHAQHPGQTNPYPGSSDAWVTNLRTGVRVDWGSPDFPLSYGTSGEMGYPQTTGTTLAINQKVPEPCDRFGATAAFYAWTSAADDGEVTEWDYAPDAAWLPLRCNAECRKAPDLRPKEQRS